MNSSVTSLAAPVIPACRANTYNARSPSAKPHWGRSEREHTTSAAACNFAKRRCGERKGPSPLPRFAFPRSIHHPATPRPASAASAFHCRFSHRLSRAPTHPRSRGAAAGGYAPPCARARPFPIPPVAFRGGGSEFRKRRGPPGPRRGEARRGEDGTTARAPAVEDGTHLSASRGGASGG